MGEELADTGGTTATAPDYDAIVVGSGFGGAVAAARLSQAGLRVAVVERGRRWTRGTFPRDDKDLRDGWLWSHGHGLYDIKWLDRMISVQGAGWGGGSLVYASVFARPPADSFQHPWPQSYSRETLDPYYDLAAHMLEVRTVAKNPATGDYPVRTRAMEQIGADLGRPSGTVRPLLAVRFGDDPGAPITNIHGVEQHACTFVAECVLGCNIGAKNSTDHNYLAIAERLGATAMVNHEVTNVRQVDGGAAGLRYAIDFTDHETGTSGSISAPRVFLGAGAVGTTELLLRSRNLHRSLPALSTTLGERYSGNGDFLAFVHRTATPVGANEAPTITSTSIVDLEVDGEPVWFQVQDGSFPNKLTALIAGLDPLGHEVDWLRAEAEKVHAPDPKKAAEKNNTLILLLMGRDASRGRLYLDATHGLRVRWRNHDNERLYSAEGRISGMIATALGGELLESPNWRYLRRAVTVHNLGGVPMGETVETGVVDEHGEVHGYPGLFVVDGSAIPAATGVNPSATIAAVAERNVERVIRGVTGDPTWVAPETADVVPAPVPEDAAMAAMAADRAEGHATLTSKRYLRTHPRPTRG